MIVILAGGTGSIKLVRGFSSIVDDVVIISNVADNFWYYDLYICPDIDTVIYGLSKTLDRERGWGIQNDTFNFLNRFKEIGGSSWFHIGDQDLAIHIIRTFMLHNKKSLSEVTDYLTKKFSIKNKILPISDDHYETRFVTKTHKDLHIQEFWVQYKGLLDISNIYYKNINNVHTNPKALSALDDAEMIIIAPGNPISSIGPMVTLTDFNSKLSEHKHKVFAISPLIGSNAISGPAVRYLQNNNIDISPFGIAKFYSNFIAHLVISNTDSKYAQKIRNLGINTIETNIIMNNLVDEINLAQKLLNKK